MGTSASHSSPRGQSGWHAVRAAYEAGAQPAEVAPLLARAIPDSVLRRFADPDRCSRALRALADPDGQLGNPAATLWQGDGSLETDLARTAAIRARLAADEGSAPASATQFAAEYAAAIAEHAAARDLEEHVGGPSLPDVGAMATLVERIGDEVRREVLGLPSPGEAGETRAPEGEGSDPGRDAADRILGAFAALRRRGTADA